MVSAVAKLLDNIANQEALHARDVAIMPGLLERAGLDPDDIDDETIREAERHHRDEFRRWCRRHGAVGTRLMKAVILEAEEDPFAYLREGERPPTKWHGHEMLPVVMSPEEEDPFA